MHAQHMAVVEAPEGIGAQHGHRLDRELVQRPQPVAEDAVEAHAVKVNRITHTLCLFSLDGRDNSTTTRMA